MHESMQKFAFNYAYLYIYVYIHCIYIYIYVCFLMLEDIYIYIYILSVCMRRFCSRCQLRLKPQCIAIVAPHALTLPYLGGVIHLAVASRMSYIYITKCEWLNAATASASKWPPHGQGSKKCPAGSRKVRFSAGRGPGIKAAVYTEGPRANLVGATNNKYYICILYV